MLNKILTTLAMYMYYVYTAINLPQHLQKKVMDLDSELLISRDGTLSEAIYFLSSGERIAKV